MTKAARAATRLLAAEEIRVAFHASRCHERDLQLLGNPRQQDHVRDIVFARMTAALEPFDAWSSSWCAGRAIPNSSPQFIERDRQVAHALAGRVIDRVGDCRGDADDADLAQPLD